MRAGAALPRAAILAASLLAVRGPAVAQHRSDPGAAPGEIEVGVELFDAEIYAPVPLPPGAAGPFSARLLTDLRGAFHAGATVRRALGAPGAGAFGGPGVGAFLSVSFDNVRHRRFYGYGNASDAELPERYYRYQPLRVAAKTGLEVALGSFAALQIGPSLEVFSTDGYLEEPDEGDPLGDDGVETGDVLRRLRPYGTGLFTSLALSGRLVLDTGSPFDGHERGVKLTTEGLWSPRALSADDAFASARTEAAAFWRIEAPGRPLLGARVGIETIRGGAPFHEAAYLGGGSNLRGFLRQRFAGETVFWSAVEVRVEVMRVRVFGKELDAGPLFFSDFGRVYHRGDSYGDLHRAVGEGVWVRPAGGGPDFTISLGHGELTTLHLGVGLLSWDG